MEMGFRERKKVVILMKSQTLLQTYQAHAGDAIEDAGHDPGLPIAQLFIEGAGGGVPLVGVHAQDGAAVFQSVFLIKTHESGADAPASSSVWISA